MKPSSLDGRIITLGQRRRQPLYMVARFWHIGAGFPVPNP
jgi:hypothetical protein